MSIVFTKAKQAETFVVAFVQKNISLYSLIKKIKTIT